MERAIRTWAGVTSDQLDRPNAVEQLGSPALAIFSPQTQIHAREVMQRLYQAMHATRNPTETALLVMEL